MQRKPCRSWPWTMLGTVAVASLAVMSCASAGVNELFAAPPRADTSISAGKSMTLLAAIPGPSEPLTTGVSEEVSALEAPQLARAQFPLDPRDPLQRGEETFIEESDPWEPFNEQMFSFNRTLDRFVLKPVGRVWDKVLPDPVKRSLDSAFDNLSMPRRLVNNLLQLKLLAAGQELGRFLLNSTIGLAGLFDVAKPLGLEQSDEDTGQTLGVYGVGPGPYLILPFLPPLTVRDGIGLAVDGALDPFNYVIFPVAALTGITAGKRVNDRALNLELFETFEETTLDLYSAARNAYLQRRQHLIEK